MSPIIWKRIGRGVQLCFVLVLLLGLSGCVELEYVIEIRPDGTQSVSLKLGLPQFIPGQAQSLQQSIQAQGYQVQIENAGDKVFIVGTQAYPEGEWELPYPEELTEGNPEFNATYFNFWLFTYYALDARLKLAPSLLNQSLGEVGAHPYLKNLNLDQGLNIPITYRLTLPGSLAQHNAQAREGNQLIWKADLVELTDIHMQANAYQINYSVLGTLCGIGFLLVILKKKKKVS